VHTCHSLQLGSIVHVVLKTVVEGGQVSEHREERKGHDFVWFLKINKNKGALESKC
jgi:hypothetical protein